MKISVTGGLGTLGVPIVKHMRACGHDVQVLDLVHTDDPASVRCDIRNFRRLFRELRCHDPEVVLNLAAEFGRKNGEDHFEDCWSTNVVGMKNIIRVQEDLGFHLVQAGSSEAYGECVAVDEQGMPDEDGRIYEFLLDPNDLRSVHPSHHNDYAISKWVNEQQIRNSIAENGTRSTVLRFFNAYGPGEYPTPYRSVVCLFVEACLKRKPITVYKGYHRVFQYIDDMVASIVRACERKPGGSINLGGEEYCSVERMLQIVQDACGTFPLNISIELAEDMNVQNKRPSISIAKRVLDHDPSILLEEGIPRTVDWMRGVYARRV